MTDQSFGVPEDTPADAECADTDHGDLQERIGVAPTRVRSARRLRP